MKTVGIMQIDLLIQNIYGKFVAISKRKLVGAELDHHDISQFIGYTQAPLKLNKCNPTVYDIKRSF